MAIVILSHSAPFPVGPLRAALERRLPGLRWTCGEEDSGNPDAQVRYRASQLVCGRCAKSSVFTDVRWSASTFAGPAPAHSCHVNVGSPTTDDRALAEKITVLIAATLMTTDQAGAMVQLKRGGNWMNFDEARRACRAVLEGETIAQVEKLLGLRSASFAAPPPPQPQPAAEPEPAPAFVPGAAAPACLPGLVLLLAGVPSLDWNRMGHGLNAVDPEGGWSAAGEDDGTGELRGRGCSVRLTYTAHPLPSARIEAALPRSFWVRNKAAIADLRRHTARLTISCDADCSALGPAATRQLAKVMAMALAVCAKAAPLAGIYNVDHGALHTADQIGALVGPLGSDEVPIKLFVWTTFHSVEEDAISLSTAGLMPFAGHEVEAWNAPGTIEYIGEKLNGVLRYLLINGPVIGHGETLGGDADDRSLRCFHGASKAPRAQAVPAMLLEFGVPPQGSAPRADLAPPAAPPHAMSRPGTFGRRTLGELDRRAG